jgi:hypothetical protein
MESEGSGQGRGSLIATARWIFRKILFCSAPRYTPVTITACSGSSRWRSLAVSSLSLYYYLIILKVIFVDESAEPETSLPRRTLGEGGNFLQRTSLTVLEAAVLFLGLWPTTLVARIIASLP